MTRNQWVGRLAGLTFLLLLAANIYMFLNRDWESSFYPTSYATLYYPLDVPTIQEWKVLDRTHLQLFLKGAVPVEEWQVYTNGANPQRANGMTPSFAIDTTFAQVNTYRFVPVPEHLSPAIEISVQVYPREFYNRQGMQRNVDNLIVRSNVPCGDFEQYALKDWVDDYNYVGKEGLAETDRLLREEVGISDGESTFTRMEKITRYLRIKLKNARGVPKNDERWMDPWMLYKEMAAGTGKGWCTQHAQLYVYWANRAGIPTRFVFGAHTQDNTITYTGHAFAESFIKEQNRWAFVDLSHSFIYITDKKGQVLNTAELFHLNQFNAFDSTMARIYADWEWQSKFGLESSDTLVSWSYSQCNSTIRGEFIPQSIFKFRRPPNVEDVRDIYTGFYRDQTFLWGNLERYLFKPQLAYSLYPTEGKTTYAIRLTLFFGMAANLILWIVIFFIGKKRKSSVQRTA